MPHTNGHFPTTRLRRNRSDAWLREMLAETRLSPYDLIWPIFVQEGKNKSTAIATMRDVSRFSIDLAVKAAKAAKSLGIPAIALFPVTEPKLKTPDAREAWNKKNLVCRAIAAVKDAVPEIGVIADVALDPYTTHGHDGIVLKHGARPGGRASHQLAERRPTAISGEIAGDIYIDNDATLEALVKQSLTQARAGCDVIAPSDMMDGRVGKIRAALDAEGFEHVKILAYAAKYASSFYGPFRDAVGSAKNLGTADKRTYQMDPANAKEALREIALDIKEGADMVMVKPGLPYLDIIRTAADTFSVPVLAYQVSGEYAMIHAAAQTGAFDANAAMLESLLCLKRAGARAILTYGAKQAAQLCK